MLIRTLTLMNRMTASPSDEGGEAVAAPAPEAAADPAPAGDPPADAPPADAPAEADAGDGYDPDDLIGGKPPEGEPEPDAAAAEGEPDADKDATPGDDEPADFSKLTLPDGFEGLDNEAVELAKPVLDKLGLTTQGQVQEAVTLYTQLGQRLVQQAFNQALETHAERVKEWRDEARAHPDLGGGNVKEFAASMALAERTLAQFGTPRLTADLRENGMANHPDLVRMFALVGRAVAEDSVEPPAAQHKQAADPAHKMFPAFAPKS